jgi:hypothetical protein
MFDPSSPDDRRCAPSIVNSLTLLRFDALSQQVDVKIARTLKPIVAFSVRSIRERAIVIDDGAA